jgi:hypothetical protein
MKALTIHQPWASAIASGMKRFETRSWKTSYRGPLVIHAARMVPAYAKEFATVEAAIGRLRGPYPFGAVLCLVTLVDCRLAEEVAREISAIERLYGDYTAGRWAWQLDDVRVLSEPLAARGKQGLWNWPDDAPPFEFEAA